jgi:hypothetical protein
MRQISSEIHRYNFVLIVILGCLVFGILTHYALHYLLLVRFTVSIVLSVIISFILLGLSVYYLRDKRRTRYNSNANNDSNAEYRNAVLSVIFVITYIASLLTITLSFPFPSANSELYTEWPGQFNIARLTAAILLSFFLPGYAIIKMLSDRTIERSSSGTIRSLQLLRKLLPRSLVAYFFSILVTSLTTYLVIVVGYSMPADILHLPEGVQGDQLILNTPDLIIVVLIIVYTVVLAIFSIHQRSVLRRIMQRPTSNFSFHIFDFRNPKALHSDTRTILRSFFYNTEKFSQCIVFAGLVALVIFYTYYLDRGLINGDQWSHHGRALLINSGSFMPVALSGADSIWYPPVFSSLLAAFFDLSGIPSVNAYVSINFLNVMPIFAFYYFFTQWVPERRKKAALLATTLFTIGSGFGWIYLLGAMINENVTTYESALQLFESVSSKTHDVRTPTSFINVGHPTPGSPLLIIALPAGLILLGVVRENYINNRLMYFLLVSAISTLGIFMHDEFYLFIIISSLGILILKIEGKSIVFISFLSALSLVILLNVISPLKYYTTNEILNVPLLYLNFIFVCIIWLIYKAGILYKLFDSSPVSRGLKKMRSFNHRVQVGIIIISIVAYLYLFTFIVWEQRSVDDILTDIGGGKGVNVPWYLYPMKLGIVGIIGIIFLLSYIFKRFEKELFIFVIIIVAALFAGPYYNEHRFSKYLMMGMAGLAAMLIYELLLVAKDKLKPNFYTVSCGALLGIIIASAGFSILLFAAYKDLTLENSKTDQNFHLVDFPSSSDLVMLGLLRTSLDDPTRYNVAIQDNDDDSPINTRLFDMIEGFSGIPLTKLHQSPLTLNATTLEGFYTLLESSNTKYIVLPKEYVDSYGKQAYLSYPMLFALDNFPRVFENSNYLVLEVPPLSPPRASSPSSQPQSVSLHKDSSTDSDVALIYQKDAQEWMMPLLSNKNNIITDSNTDKSFISTISDYGNESLTSPSSLFDFVATNDADTTLSRDDKENSNSKGKDPLLSSIPAQNLVRVEKKQGINAIVLDSMIIANIDSVIDSDEYNDGNSRNDRIVLWSKPIPTLLKGQQYSNGTVDYYNESDYNKNVNYIEGTLRVLAENTHRSNDAGILWKYGSDREYYLSLEGSRMVLTQREKQVTNPSISNSNNQKEDSDKEREETKTRIKTSLLVQNQEIRRERGLWYNIKILMVDNNFIDIYLDDMLRIQVPIRNSTSTSTSDSTSTTSASTSTPSSSSSSSLPSSSLPPSISRVGIRSSNNIAEFQAIKVGHISPPTNHESDTTAEKVQQTSSDSSNSSSQALPYPSLASYIKEKKYERHYYPLSMLALSNANYDSFIEGDLSAFSKKYVILPFDPPINGSVNDTLLQPPYDTSYKYDDNLVKYYLEYVRNGGNLIVLDSEYGDDALESSQASLSNLLSTDFIDFTNPIDKKYGNGNIIVVDAGESFNDILRESPQRHKNNKDSFYDFMGYHYVPRIFTSILGGLREIKPNPEDKSFINNPLSSRAILGDLGTSGKTTITTSSVLFPNTEESNLPLYVRDISISNDTQEHTGVFSNSSLRRQNDSESVKIEQLGFFGKYKAVVDMKGSSVLPTTLSNYDYVMMSFNKEFDLILTFRDGSYADISLLDKGVPKNFRIQNATVHFYNVTANHVDDKYVPLLFKNPEINIIGSSSFREYKEKNVNQISINGSLISKFDHSDHYYSDYRNGSRIAYISYLQDSQVKGKSVSTQNSFGIKLPGGLSERWESEVQWPEAVVSINSIIIASLIAIVSILVWPGRKRSKKEAKVSTKDPQFDPRRNE